MAQAPGQPDPYQQQVNPYQQGSGPSGPRAGFWVRFGAAFLDGILLGVVNGILAAAMGANTGRALSVVIGVAYYGILEGGESGQTLGKKVAGIRVIDMNGAGPIGIGRAIGRYFARWLSALPILLGYFWMLWDKEKQTWHDKLTSALVVPVSAYPLTPTTPGVR
jgi:uncharacterized RDD family membrane protein YckC